MSWLEEERHYEIWSYPSSHMHCHHVLSNFSLKLPLSRSFVKAKLITGLDHRSRKLTLYIAGHVGTPHPSSYSLTWDPSNSYSYFDFPFKIWQRPTTNSLTITHDDTTYLQLFSHTGIHAISAPGLSKLCKHFPYSNWRHAFLYSYFWKSFLKKCYWNITDLQSYVSFRYIAYQFSYMYIYSFSDSFPMQIITEH